MNRPRKPTSGIQYDSCSRTYRFFGEWTEHEHPRRRRSYQVQMEGDGLWLLFVDGARVQSGEGRLPSRANARKIVILYRANYGPKEPS